MVVYHTITRMAEEFHKFIDVSIGYENLKSFTAALHLMQKIGKEFSIGN